MDKRVCYIGAGPASIISAIMLKSHRPEVDVFIIERNEQPLKKLKVTGNGKCNIAPLKDDVRKYNNQEFVKELFDEIPLDEYLQILLDVGIETKTIRDFGYYPISESAPNVASILLNRCHRLGIKIIHDEIKEFKHVDQKFIIKGKEEYVSDYLIIGCGGAAQYKETNPIFDELKKNHEFIPFTPSLCPIKVKEDVKSLFGVREYVFLSLMKNDRSIKDNEGELQFKKDGLSGICIMNLSKYISPSEIYTIKVDFTFEKHIAYSDSFMVKEFLLSIVKEPLANYIIKNLKLDPNAKLSKELFNRLLDYLSQITFTVKELYGLNESQTSRGGISVDSINKNFSSKREENLYIIGESLDVDAECGGYSLRFAITSGVKAAIDLLRK